MVSNAHAGAENGDFEVRALLGRQHRRLRDALHAALLRARAHGQLAPGTDPAAAAEVLALLTHGVNLRSRAGADADQLRKTVATALHAFSGPAA